MAQRTISTANDQVLCVTIERADVAYTISEFVVGTSWRVDDETLIEIAGKIRAIGAEHKQFVGRPIALTLSAARSFDEDGERNSDATLIGSLQLRKSGCAASAYLPHDAHAKLWPMTRCGDVNEVQIFYERPRYGSADVTSLHFTRAPKGEV